MNEKSGNGADEQQQQPALIVNGQYIKDLSFEAPNSPAVLADLQGGKQPDVNVNVNINAGKIEGQADATVSEVVLEIHAEMTVDGKTGFVAELQYAGVFTLNVPEEHMNAVQMIECPRMLFPFARAILSDMTRDGGFVPLLLQPIDFAAMYQASLQQQASDLEADITKTIEEKSKA